MGKALTSVSIVSIRLIEASTKSRGDTSFDRKRATASVAVILIKSSRTAVILQSLTEINSVSNLKNQRQVYVEMRKKNIGVNLHYIPVHRQPYYENLNFKYGDFPISEKFHKEAISIPIFPTLQEEHQEYVISTIKKIII